MINQTLETITPSIAECYLSKNKGNRPIRKGSVASLARAIRRGDWRITHQGIAFMENGDLGDGQHRLKAIVVAGIPVQVLVARGLKDEDLAVIDTGSKRSVSDSLKIPKKDAEVLNFIASLLVLRTGLSPQLVAELSRPFAAKTAKLHEFCGSKAKVLSSTPVKAAAIVRMVLHPEEEPAILESYAALVSLDFGHIPPIAQSFVRGIYREVEGEGVRVRHGHVNAGEARILFAKATSLFDPQKAALSKLLVVQRYDGSLSAINDLRNAFYDHICAVEAKG